MKPTEILMNEHRIIEQVLNCLEKIAKEGINQGHLEKEPAEQAVDFFRSFADHCHHCKEEDHLFPMMESKGFARESGPTGVMLHEHEEGRSYVKGMSDAIPAASQGDKEALQRFIQHANSYVHMLREHIQKEDHCLFSMANQAMSDEDQQLLQSKFDQVEHEKMGEGIHDKYLQIAQSLAERYNVPQVQTEDMPKCCGHQN